MARKLIGLFLLSLLLTTPVSAYIDQHIRHTVQINTRMDFISGVPTWLLIIRDERTGRILPYMFDFYNYDNFWLAFATARTYRITASTLKFAPGLVIENFCGLENRMLVGKSMRIRLTGALTPNRCTSVCKVKIYNDMGFTIVQPY